MLLHCSSGDETQCKLLCCVEVVWSLFHSLEKERWALEGRARMLSGSPRVIGGANVVIVSAATNGNIFLLSTWTVPFLFFLCMGVCKGPSGLADYVQWAVSQHPPVLPNLHSAMGRAFTGCGLLLYATSCCTALPRSRPHRLGTRHKRWMQQVPGGWLMF